jgi:hypothetical protein
MDTPHIVPLSRQSVEVLRALKLPTGNGRLAFPGANDRNKPMSNNTILYALYRLGYRDRMTGHGFRGLASTILNENGFEEAHIESSCGGRPAASTCSLPKKSSPASSSSDSATRPPRRSRPSAPSRCVRTPAPPPSRASASAPFPHSARTPPRGLPHSRQAHRDESAIARKPDPSTRYTGDCDMPGHCPVVRPQTPPRQNGNQRYDQ